MNFQVPSLRLVRSLIEKRDGVRESLKVCFRYKSFSFGRRSRFSIFVRNLYKVINLINRCAGVVCVIYTRGNFKGPISFPWDSGIYTLSKPNSLNFPQIRFIYLVLDVVAMLGTYSTVVYSVVKFGDTREFRMACCILMGEFVFDN